MFKIKRRKYFLANYVFTTEKGFGYGRCPVEVVSFSLSAPYIRIAKLEKELETMNGTKNIKVLGYQEIPYNTYIEMVENTSPLLNQ